MLDDVELVELVLPGLFLLVLPFHLVLLVSKASKFSLSLTPVQELIRPDFLPFNEVVRLPFVLLVNEGYMVIELLLVFLRVYLGHVGFDT